MSLGRLIRTVRHLRPVQIYGRLAVALPRPRPGRSPTAPRRALPGPWSAPIARSPSLIGPAEVRLLNLCGRIDGAEAWNDPARSKLWLYNLHYFNDLAAPDKGERALWRRGLVARWIAENPPTHGVGWEPFPTSLRIVSWIKWALSGEAMPAAWQDSLALQVRWLRANLEWRLLGNHLLANAKALIFAGLYFAGSEADLWLKQGLCIYQRQLAVQVLADGGHLERSPMYHALVLEDLLDLINLARASGAVEPSRIADWSQTAERMGAWLSAMTHPDGQIGFFNDAAFAIAAAPQALFAYARRLGLAAPAAKTGATWLSASGYVRLAGDEAVALIDAAPIGPDHLPGHAHADTLSFELSLGVERIIVNGGTSVYGDDLRRQSERSTAAHSTVQIDGRDSSEVWAGFRVGRRARVREVTVAEDQGGFAVCAAHDGYAFRPGRPIHRRTWRLHPGRLSVTDAVEGRAASAVARFHLGPGVQGHADSGGLGGELIAPSGRRVRWRSSEPARLEPSHWRPQFGMRLDTRQLVAPVRGAGLQTQFSW